MNNNPSYGSQSWCTKSATYWFVSNTKNIYFTNKQRFEFNAVIFKQFFFKWFSLLLGESRALEMPSCAPVSVGDKIDLTVNAIQDKVAH